METTPYHATEIAEQAQEASVDRGPAPVVQKGMGFFGVLITSGLMSALVVVGGLYLYHTRYRPEIVAVDIQGYINSLMDEVRQGRMDEQGAKRAVDRLHAAIADLPEKYIPISTEVILRRGVPEVELPPLGAGGNGASVSQGAGQGGPK